MMTEFPSTLDTVNSDALKKTVLLQSSPYSRVLPTPAIIDLTMLEKNPDAADYQKPAQAVALLLEGKFKSLFANRIPPLLKDNFKRPLKKDSSERNAMLVCSDGDLIKNQLHYNQHYPLPLGYDQFTQQSFGNKDFIINALNYLTEENGLIAIRSREIKMRMLDKNKVEEHLIFIQILNVFLPLFLILLLGLFLYYYRRNKYTV